MTFSFSTLSPLAALIAGILILIMPRLLNYVIAVYLIAVGIMGIADRHHARVVQGLVGGSAPIVRQAETPPPTGLAFRLRGSAEH